MSTANRFRHQAYCSDRPTSPYLLLGEVSPTLPSTAEFQTQLASAGEDFSRAGVSAIYCVHGTFVGDDFFGLTTELSRFLPSLGNRLGRCRKRLIESIAGEIAAGILTRGANNRMGKLIGKLGDRNLLQVKIDPDYRLGEKDIFGQYLGNHPANFSFTTIAIPMEHDENCPDCMIAE